MRALQFSSEYSNEDLRNLQEDDPSIAPVLNFLEHDITPSRNDLRALPLESRIIWSHRPTVKILEGILVRHVKDNVQLVVPQTLRRRLFDASHSGPLAAHLGAERMIKQLKSQYYWPGLDKDTLGANNATSANQAKVHLHDLMVVFKK